MKVRSVSVDSAEYLAAQASNNADRDRNTRQVAFNRALEDVNVFPEGWGLSIGTRHGDDLQAWRTVGRLNVIGLDLLPELAYEEGCCVCRTDMHSIPFEDNTFAFVYMRDSLEHSPDVPLALREVLRVLRPGGLVLVNSPIGMEQPTHFTTFDHGDLELVVRCAGFQNVTTIYNEPMNVTVTGIKPK